MRRILINITLAGFVVLGAALFDCESVTGGERAPWQPPALCGSPFFQEETLKLYNKFGRPTRIPERVLMDLGRVDTLGRPLSAAVGDQETFWAYSWVTDGFYQVVATLEKIGIHCYIYVEDGQTVSSAVLNNLTNEFDTNIYPTDTSIFGSEPDVDGDPRITILLLDIKDGYDGTGGFIAGYFHSRNEFNTTNSNLREMFYIDLDPGRPGSTQSFGTLAHEFQHMIHFNQDVNESTWVNEGCSTLAEFLCGYGHDSNIGEFLDSPDNGLIHWPLEGGELADYGQVYLFLYYLWEKYGGNSFVTHLTQNQQNGTLGVNSSLAAKGYSDDFNTILPRWVVANYLDNTSIEGGKYGYAGLDITAFRPGGIYLSNTWSSYPVASSGSVEHYAADYVKFTNGSNVTFSFNGEDGNNFNLFLIDEGPTPQVVEIALNSTNEGTSSSFISFSSVVMIPISVSFLGGKTYSYSTDGTAPSSTSIQIKRFASDLTTSTPPNGPFPVTFTVDAEGAMGKSLYYRFLETPFSCDLSRDWNEIRGYSQNSSASWYPSTSGKYIIVVHVSDNPTSPPDPVPQAGLVCEVTLGTSLVQVQELATDLSFEALVNQPVNIEVSAQGAGGLQHRFLVSPYGGSMSWTEIQSWSTNSLIQWIPAFPGSYIVVVHTAQDTQTNCPAQIGLTITIVDEGDGRPAVLPSLWMAGAHVGALMGR